MPSEGKEPNDMRRSERAKMDREICATVWTSPHAQTLMDALSYDIGPRPPGSKAMREAQRLLADVLRKLGARNIHREPVPVLGWRPVPAKLELMTPYRRVYESIQHVHSASGSFTAPLIEGGGISDETLDRLGCRVRGAVLLARGHEVSGDKYLPLFARVRKALERGALGVIARNMYPGVGPAIELMGVSQQMPIAVLGVSHEQGFELASLIRRSRARVRIDTAGKSYDTRCSNLVADIGPSRTTSEMIILSAHLDSFYSAPGSFDNLSGVVTLVEIARALAPARSKFRRTFRLVAFTGEEYGFAGSKSYVRRHANELDSLRFIFNMDSLFPSTAEGIAVMWAPEMRAYIESALRETQRNVDVRNHFCMSSDYLPFMLEGIAAAKPADWKNSFPPWSHTHTDCPDKVPPNWIRLNAMTFAQLLIRLLVDPRPLPAKRRPVDEIRDLIAQEGIEEVLCAYELGGQARDQQ